MSSNRRITNQEQRAASELTRRRNDGLELFRAMPSQMPVVLSTASELGVWGGNRSGKSTISALKFAAVARDKPLYGPDGTAYEQRLPHQKGRKLIMWVVGLQLNHIGQTIHRLLFRPGLYKMVRDVQTRRWRAYNPEVDGDVETKPSFPLIPQSEVKAVSWANKAGKQFEMIELEHATIYAFASTADVKQGDPIDYIWIDERIQFSSHYPEWQARLSDVKGRIVWSSMPRADNGAMLRLNHRAQEQAEELADGHRDHVDVEVVRLQFSANPHIDDEEKRKRLEGWTEDERKQRDLGLFLTDNIKIFPTFDRDFHRAVYRDPAEDDAISRILRERNGEPPVDWTREMILDPGTAKPAVLFGAVPPPELWSGGVPYFIVYREIYQPRTDASKLAELMKQAAAGYVFRRFIIDQQAARQTPMGFSGTVGDNYSHFLREQNLRSEETQFGFIPGDPNIEARWQLVERALAVRTCGKPQLRIVVENCPKLVWQLENNVKAVQKDPISGVDVILERAAKGQQDDLRNCCEYWLSRAPIYVPPSEMSHAMAGPGMRAYQSINRMFGGDRKSSDRSVHCGPGAAPTSLGT